MKSWDFAKIFGGRTFNGDSGSNEITEKIVVRFGWTDVFCRPRCPTSVKETGSDFSDPALTIFPNWFSMWRAGPLGTSFLPSILVWIRGNRKAL